MKLTELPRIDRPREKLEKYGPDKLSNAELLALILRSGIKGKNVLELSRSLLKQFSGKSMAEADVAALKNMCGLGTAKACEIVACFELGRRMFEGKPDTFYMSSREVWDALKDVRDHKKEHFIVLFLDARNREIRRETISIGTLTANLVHPREVFEPAISHTAAQIIVSHNHPSGNPEPSAEDRLVTKRLVESGKLLGIEVLDHVVISKTGFYSFKANELI